MHCESVDSFSSGYYLVDFIKLMINFRAPKRRKEFFTISKSYQIIKEMFVL